MKNTSLYLLAAWLILSSLMTVFKLSFDSDQIILALLALAAGVSIIVDHKRIPFDRDIGISILSIWLITSSLFSLINLNFEARDILMALVAMAAGIALILKRQKII